MTNERNNEDRDQLVRDTYKELADERAPDRLNDRVLKQAAKAGRSRYSLTRAWTRPVAWAATIGLSLAIVLELTRLPQTEPDVVGISAPDEPVPEEERATADAPDASMDDFSPKDMTLLRDAENMARVQAGANQAPVAVSRAAEKIELESDDACPKKSRESAESWFACIEQLRADGRADRAASEYEKFRRKFPDFVDFTGDR